MIAATDTLESFLELPREIAIETPAEVMGAPENCEPASWNYVQVDDAIVYRAVKKLLILHADELQDIMTQMYFDDAAEFGDDDAD